MAKRVKAGRTDQTVVAAINEHAALIEKLFDVFAGITPLDVTQITEAIDTAVDADVAHEAEATVEAAELAPAAQEAVAAMNAVTKATAPARRTPKAPPVKVTPQPAT